MNRRELLVDPNASTQFQKRGFRVFGEGLKIGDMLS